MDPHLHKHLTLTFGILGIYLAIWRRKKKRRVILLHLVLMQFF